MGWLAKILARRKAAALALALAEQLLQAGEELAELHRRMQRPADERDLRDTLEKLRQLQLRASR